MKKSAVIMIGVLVLSALLMAAAYSQEEMQAVDNQAFPSPQRPPSLFRHDEHNATAAIEECNVCHHVYDDTGKLVEGESSEDQGCSECHAVSDSGNQPGLRKAFHLNCKGCHREQQKGPILCGECHVKA
jgi:hypothetical protein